MGDDANVSNLLHVRAGRHSKPRITETDESLRVVEKSQLKNDRTAPPKLVLGHSNPPATKRERRAPDDSAVTNKSPGN
jgi:hypothetical protein